MYRREEENVPAEEAETSEWAEAEEGGERWRVPTHEILTTRISFRDILLQSPVCIFGRRERACYYLLTTTLLLPVSFGDCELYL